MFEFPTCGSDTVAGPRSAKGSTAATENLVASPTMEEDQENQTSASNNAPMQLSPTPPVPQMADDRSSCTRTLVRRCADEKIVFNNYKDHDTMALEASSDFVKLNVGGHVFLTRRCNFSTFPLSRLGRLMRAKNEDRVLELCNAYDPGFNDETLGTSRTIPMYYFDHNGRDFEQVLDLYRHGCLHVFGVGNGSRCPRAVQRELEYWGIDEYSFEACCSLQYHQGIEDCLKEIETANKVERRAEEGSEDSYGRGWTHRIRRKLWSITEYPESSNSAKAFAVISMLVILMSTATFLFGVFFDLDEEIMTLENQTFSGPESNSSSNNYTSSTFPFSPEDCARIGRLLALLDTLSIAFFTLEYLVRLACAPHTCKFVMSPLSLTDLLAILPFLLSWLMHELQALNIVGKATKLLHLIRILKVFRVFKLVRHLGSLQSLLTTLKQANKEIWLLGVMTALALLMFSTLTYYAERDYASDVGSEEDAFTFGECLAYSVLTLTTVGFSGRQPSSNLGRVSGGFCAVLGAFAMTLPIPIVINSFAGYYRNKLVKKVTAVRRCRRLGERRRALRFQAIGILLDEAAKTGTASAV